MRHQLEDYRNQPLAFVEEVLHGRPWSKQKEILNALGHHPKITVRSAHTVGKSWLAACAVLIPNDPVLASQLASLTYEYTSRGQLKVESKKDLRRRGLPSPDRADALALAFYPHPLPGVFRPCFLVGKPRRGWPYRRRF